MNSMQRAMTAIQHQQPDRVPMFHLLSHYGAKERGISVEKYFSDPELVAATQLQMREKYSNDCLYTFAYAPLEVEAFGGEVVFRDEAPPNSGEPFLKGIDQISTLEFSDIGQMEPLRRVLQTTALLKKEVGDEVPIIGVVMSPFSLPVMQMGFEKYLELLYFRPEDHQKLMAFNEDFCVAWANAQLQAGATAICFFDPLASPAMIDRDLYLKTGFQTARRTIGRFQGAAAMHLASGIATPVIEDVAATGAAVLGFSADDDVAKIKQAAANKICLLGNLNGIDMVRWDRKKASSEVRKLIEKAAPGGGFILSDNHGELPWQVSEDVLLEIAETVKASGVYPRLGA